MPSIPPALDHVVRRCLEKHPDDRWQSAHDVASQLEWLSGSGSQGAGWRHCEAQARRRVPVRYARPSPRWRPSRCSRSRSCRCCPETSPKLTYPRLLPPPAPSSTSRRSTPARSPSRPTVSQIALTAREQSGQRALWIESLDSARAAAARWHRGCALPVLVTRRPLRRVLRRRQAQEDRHLRLRTVRHLRRRVGRSGAWNRDGVILFSSEGTSRSRASVTREACRRDHHDRRRKRRDDTPMGDRSFPTAITFSTLLERTRSAVNSTSTRSTSLAGRTGKTKVRHQRAIERSYASGHLLYVRDNVLVAQPFDPKSTRDDRKSDAITEGVRYSVPFFRGVYSVSDNGVAGLSARRRQPELAARLVRPGRAPRPERSGAKELPRTARDLTDGRDRRVDRRRSTGLRDIWLFDPRVIRRPASPSARSRRTRRSVSGRKRDRLSRTERRESERVVSCGSRTNGRRRRDAPERARLGPPDRMEPRREAILASKQRPSGDWDLVALDRECANATAPADPRA